MKRTKASVSQLLAANERIQQVIVEPQNFPTEPRVLGIAD